MCMCVYMYTVQPLDGCECVCVYLLAHTRTQCGLKIVGNGCVRLAVQLRCECDGLVDCCCWWVHRIKVGGGRRRRWRRWRRRRCSTRSLGDAENVTQDECSVGFWSVYCIINCTHTHTHIHTRYTHRERGERERESEFIVGEYVVCVYVGGTDAGQLEHSSYFSQPSALTHKDT